MRCDSNCFSQVGWVERGETQFVGGPSPFYGLSHFMFLVDYFLRSNAMSIKGPMDFPIIAIPAP